MTLERLFSCVFNMSLTASVVILLVLLLRLVLRKAPKVFSYALWGVVLFRLLCPVSFSSGLSVLGWLSVPAQQTAGSEHTTSIQYVAPESDEHSELPLSPFEPSPAQLPQEDSVPIEAPPMVKSSPDFRTIAPWVWLAGVTGLGLYSLWSYLRLRKQLVGACLLKDNVYLSDYIPSAFVVGLVRPRIYLPSSLTDREQQYIICHEQYHLHRGDHWIKLLSFAALCLHWFNPLVWLAFVLSTSDMEMSCDEGVIRKMGTEIRADYSASLLRMSMGQRARIGMPLAFGEGSTKSRIYNLARYKKPALWVLTAAAGILLVAVVCLTANPRAKVSALPTALTCQIQREPVEEIEPSAPEVLELNFHPADSTAEAILEPFADLLASDECRVIFTTEDPKVDTLTLTEEYTLSTDGSGKVETRTISLQRDENQQFVFLPIHRTPDREEEAFYTIPAKDGTYTFHVSFPAETDYDQHQISYALPEDIAGTVTFSLPKDITLREVSAQEPNQPPVMLLFRKDTQVGSLELHPLGSTNFSDLVKLDVETLPMPIFASVAAANHCAYVDYAVAATHGLSGAVANARYLWQDLNDIDHDDSAANLPTQGTDCILAYQWDALPWFVQLNLEKDALSEAQNKALTESLRIQGTTANGQPLYNAQMPNVVGTSAADAMDTLSALGLFVQREGGKGFVTNQSIDSGKTICAGQEVILTCDNDPTASQGEPLYGALPTEQKAGKVTISEMPTFAPEQMETANALIATALEEERANMEIDLSDPNVLNPLPVGIFSLAFEDHAFSNLNFTLLLPEQEALQEKRFYVSESGIILPEAAVTVPKSLLSGQTIPLSSLTSVLTTLSDPAFCAQTGISEAATVQISYNGLVSALPKQPTPQDYVIFFWDLMPLPDLQTSFDGPYYFFTINTAPDAPPLRIYCTS